MQSRSSRSVQAPFNISRLGIAFSHRNTAADSWVTVWAHHSATFGIPVVIHGRAR